MSAHGGQDPCPMRGCDRAQHAGRTSSDGIVNGAGVFTTALHRIWADNGFTGSYDAFHRAIVAQMGPNQTPELGLFGRHPESLPARTPFNPRNRGASATRSPRW